MNIKNLVLPFISKQFILFVLLSSVAAIVNLLVRLYLSYVIHIYSLTIIIAYIAGMLTSYLLNKLVTFKSPETKRITLEIGIFAIINIIGILQTVGVSLLLAKVVYPAINFTYHPYFFAHLIGVAFPVITSFLGHKYITFSHYAIKKG